MKKTILSLLFFSAIAFAGYGGPMVIIDPTTQIPAQVNANHELRVIEASPIPVVLPNPLPVHEVTPVPTQSVSVVNFPAPVATQTITGAVTIPTPVPVIFASPSPTFSVSVLNQPTNYAVEAGGHLESTDSKLTTINTTLGTLFQAGGLIGNTSFGISGTLPAFAATPTFNLGTLNGAATAANQSTIITDLGAINTTLGSPFQAGGSIGNTSFGISGTLPAFAATPTFNLGTLNGAATAANQSTQITSLSSIDGKLSTTANGLKVDGSGVTQPISAASLPLPTGAATSANQSTEITSLSSISGQLPSTLSQKAMSASLPVTWASDQTPTANKTVTGSISALSGVVSVSLSGGYQSVGFELSGSWNGTLIPEATVDGTNWDQVSATNFIVAPNAIAYWGTFQQAQNNISFVTRQLGSYSQFRLRMQSYTSGTVNITMVASVFPGPVVIGDVKARLYDGGGSNGLGFGQSTMANSLPVAIASNQSAVPASQSGTWNITNISGTVSLPTGAATAAKQPALGVAGTASSDVITVQGISGMTALKVDGSGVTQPVSGIVTANAGTGTFTVDASGHTVPVSAASLPLPSGAATAANQTTANTSLSAISGQLPAALGQATKSASLPVTIASDQVSPKTYGNASAAFSQTSVTTTASTVTAPPNAVRVMIQGDSSNTDCVRYRFDGTAATSTVGVVAQPGQDSGQLDSGMNVSIASCSGTQKVNVQYFAQ